MVLKSKSEMSKVLNDEELSVWLSTTMIQALRNMISLFTHFFDSLQYMLDRFLELLALCICQENDTLARIGSNCLQQLILQNVNKFTAKHWHKVVRAFVDLFTRTEATALFSTVASSYPSLSSTSESITNNKKFNGGLENNRNPVKESLSEEKESNPLELNGRSGVDVENSTTQEAEATITHDSLPNSAEVSPKSKQDKLSRSSNDLEDYRPQSGLQQAPIVVTAERRKFFNQIITKCVLQLLMIETVNDLFSNDDVYARIPSPELLRLMAVVRRSYHFAKKFNSNLDLRTRLFKEGFMKQPPNLLKQESGSAAVYVSILFRMYGDTGAERTANREQTEQALIPLCLDIVQSFLAMNDETQQRNIATWRPVVVEVLDGYLAFSREDFDKQVNTFAPLIVGLLGGDLTHDLQRVVQGLVARVFEVKLGMEMGQDGMGLGIGSSRAPSSIASPTSTLSPGVQSPKSVDGRNRAFSLRSRSGRER